MSNQKIWNGSDHYICDPELAQAFHMARVLGMPLLIEGEPGTGKTELPLQFAKDTSKQMFVYPAGSKSNVEQFVAKFDHVKYLRDSQIEVLNAERESKGMDAKLSTGGRATERLNDYVNMGPGALAYSNPGSVLLIDEIDKAPREFPNDLLYALSHRRFVLPESGKVIEASEEDMPTIVITSNREQELPTAFKGRCIYHYIAFPQPELMKEIVMKHHPQTDTDVLEKATGVFYQMRSIGLERAPATRELLNWLKFLNAYDKDAAMQHIANMDGSGVLIKTKADMEKVKARAKFAGQAKPV